MIIEIPLKLVSENTATRCIVRGKYASPTLSEQIKDFMRNVDLELYKHRAEFKDLLNLYDKYTHGFVLSLVHKTPKLFTKKGTISENSIDVDNIKYLQDSIFRYLCIDDSQVLSLSSSKSYAKNHSILIKIELIEHGYNLI